MGMDRKKIEEALKQTNGNVSLAARTLNVSRTAVYARIERSPKLRQILTESRESLVDIAETALRSAVLSGQPWAIALTLKTIGRKRGYTERIEQLNIDSEGNFVDGNNLTLVQNNFLSRDERDAMARRLMDLKTNLTPLKYVALADDEDV